MQTKPYLGVSDVKRIAAAAETEALANQWAVTIAIVDDGGHLLWLQRLDGAAPVSSHIAPSKARTAALGRRESKVYEDVINQGRVSFLSAPTIDGLLEGGVPILVAGHCVGAVGVSGVKSTEDAQIAKAASLHSARSPFSGPAVAAGGGRLGYNRQVYPPPTGPAKLPLIPDEN